VKVSLAFKLHDHTTLLEQVIFDLTSPDAGLCVKKYLHEFSKARRVVVAKCLCVPKRLKTGVRREYALCDLIA
jgi:hypothetical protein